LIFLEIARVSKVSQKTFRKLLTSLAVFGVLKGAGQRLLRGELFGDGHSAVGEVDVGEICHRVDNFTTGYLPPA